MLVVDTGRVLTGSEIAEAAAVLRRILAAIDAGEIDADGPLGSKIVAQLNGAVVALEAIRNADKPTKDADA